VTSLEALPVQQPSNAILLKWSASDNLSGLDYFDLQWQIGTGSWDKITPQPTGTSSQVWFIASPGSNYGFRLRGVDRADNAENYPASAESRTTIPTVSNLCSQPDSWDSDRNDNSAGTAVSVDVNSVPQNHNFCNPLAGSRQNDEDWVKFSAQAGRMYVLQAFPGADMAAVSLSLFAADGTTLISGAEPSGFGSLTRLIWTPDQDGVFYLRARHVDGRVIGNAVAYQLSVREVTSIYFPVADG
jgi:hypothetical protein